MNVQNMFRFIDVNVFMMRQYHFLDFMMIFASDSEIEELLNSGRIVEAVTKCSESNSKCLTLSMVKYGNMEPKHINVFRSYRTVWITGTRFSLSWSSRVVRWFARVNYDKNVYVWKYLSPKFITLQKVTVPLISGHEVTVDIPYIRSDISLLENTVPLLELCLAVVDSGIQLPRSSFESTIRYLNKMINEMIIALIANSCYGIRLRTTYSWIREMIIASMNSLLTVFDKNYFYSP